MATMTITIPDDKVQVLVEAFAVKFHYQEFIGQKETGEMIPNPITKAQFARQQIRQFIRDVYISAMTGGLHEKMIREKASGEIGGVLVD